eukprot:1449950-Prymnesium_polylepis.1
MLHAGAAEMLRQADEHVDGLCARVARVQASVEADLLAAEAAQAGLTLKRLPGQITEWAWSRPYDVRECATGGLGGFAAAKYVANDVIIAEAPLIRWRQSMHSTPEANLAGLHRHVDELTPTQREDYFALHQNAAHGEAKSAIGIWMSNAVTTDESDPDIEDAAVFTRVSRINHACRPNAMRAWSEERGELVVRATRAIERGDEITISYISDSMEECLR